MKLWLDDIRRAPDGWTLAKTVEEAKRLLSTGEVEFASLDHDLGACHACIGAHLRLDDDAIAKLTDEEIDIMWLEGTDLLSMPHCSHTGTGYDLVKWMALTGHWPREIPSVHSRNIVGAARMRGAIARYFPQGDPESAV